MRQELWGVAVAYNLVRVEMERAAAEVGVEPTRISFVNALSLIRTAWIVWSTAPLAPGRIPEHLLDMRRQLGHLYSSHQNGISMDIGGVNSYGTRGFDWLKANAGKYGFVNDVPASSDTGPTRADPHEFRVRRTRASNFGSSVGVVVSLSHWRNQ